MRLRNCYFSWGLISILLLTGPVHAKSPWAEETTYSEKLQGKLVYGMANFWGGWLSLFYEPTEAVQSKKSIWMGVGKGLAYSVLFTVVGGVQLVTFPVTVLDIPLPHNGVEVS